MPEQIQTPPEEFSEKSEETPEISPELRFYNDLMDLKTDYASAKRWTWSKKKYADDPETAEAAERNIALCRKEFAEMVTVMRDNPCFAQVAKDMDLLVQKMEAAQFETKEENDDFFEVIDRIEIHIYGLLSEEDKAISSTA